MQIELGRYHKPSTPSEKRPCEHCQHVEAELHFLCVHVYAQYTTASQAMVIAYLQAARQSGKFATFFAIKLPSGTAYPGKTCCLGLSRPAESIN